LDVLRARKLVVAVLPSFCRVFRAGLFQLTTQWTKTIDHLVPKSQNATNNSNLKQQTTTTTTTVTMRSLPYLRLLAFAALVEATKALATSTSTSTSTHAAPKFKAPNADTAPDVVSEWREHDEALWKYVEEQVPAVLDHTGDSAFDEHLKGVQSVLRYWGSPSHLTNAGLFHSIYGTEGFQGFSLPLSERAAIQTLIGEKAERLSFWFCMVDRSTLDKTVFDWKEPVDPDFVFQMRARPELGRFDLTLNKEEWLDFVELTLADWLEQVEGAATIPSSLFFWKSGEAFAYRRLAYRKMSAILSVERSERLSEIPKQMLDAVMAMEAPETRHLVQPRTPPMSEAAGLALDALRAIGEDIPEDLSPQPMAKEECEATVS
jgi:hypothetical protein